MIDKATLRRELLQKRDRIPPEVRRSKDRLIFNHLITVDEFINANIIFAFASFRSEVNTNNIIEKALHDGKKVALPKVIKEEYSLVFYEIKRFEELNPGYMGIPEPSIIDTDRIIDINNVDVIIIPGAGFDISGNRIGYGGGYYDRLLSMIKKDIHVIAPAYEEQILDIIPSEEHDIKVDIIVTDRRIIRIR